MGGAVTGWCNDPPHWNIPMVAKIICHSRSTILAELLVCSFCSGLGGIARDLDQVTIGRGREGGELVEVSLRGVVQRVFTRGIVDDSFGDCLVIVKVGHALVHHLNSSRIRNCDRAGCCCHCACCISRCLRLVCRRLRSPCRSDSLVGRCLCAAGR